VFLFWNKFGGKDEKSWKKGNWSKED